MKKNGPSRYLVKVTNPHFETTLVLTMVTIELGVRKSHGAEYTQLKLDT